MKRSFPGGVTARTGTGITIFSSPISKEKTAFFLVERCRDEEWERLLRRTIHHAFQNGAELVCVADLEKERLKPGDRYGYYVIGEKRRFPRKRRCSFWMRRRRKKFRKSAVPNRQYGLALWTAGKRPCSLSGRKQFMIWYMVERKPGKCEKP